ncbi:MAG: amidohydrolase family protein [Actinomycetes bacterium]
MAADARVTTIVDAEVGGRRVDVRIGGERIERIGRDLPRLGTDVVRANGGALLPGLHDHHLHLLAMAARDQSVNVAAAPDADAFDQLVSAALTQHGDPEWIRVVGYDESHGPLTSLRLDALAPGRLVRVQHRSGAAWMLSPAGARAVGLFGAHDWVYRDDEHLRSAWESGTAPDLTAVGVRLARYGVTGVTDATPFDDASGFAALAAARATGALPQRVVVTGGHQLAEQRPPPLLERGPVKLVIADHEPTDLDELAARISVAHRAGRPVAVHCVTRTAIVLALVAWEAAGTLAGDRVEHASVVPLELVQRLGVLGVHVVTQPGFVHAHGDRYLSAVDADDLPHLYRCGSLIAAGINVGASTDAPFGPEDPWLAVRAAADRRTAEGVVLGGAERIPARRALDGFLTPPDQPGGAVRTVEVGAVADLCLLGTPLHDALESPDAANVAATWIAGRVVHDRT